MKTPTKKIISLIAIISSLAVSSFWAFWGIVEFFHEGWYSPSFFYGLFLFFVQYMSLAILFVTLSLLAMKNKKAGLISYISIGVFSALFFSRASFQVAYLSLAIPFVLLGLLFYYGDFSHFKKAKLVMIGVPALIVLLIGTPLLFRNLNRLDDGNYGERILDCQDSKIVWAPRGLGFPDEGVNWNDAINACKHLSLNGKEILEEVNIWRLPSITDAVKCQQSHNESAGGFWNEEKKQAEYKKSPDKETPLWQPSSEIIYYWTSQMSEESNAQAYIFTYDGKIYDKNINLAPNYQSFRCVRDYEGD